MKILNRIVTSLSVVLLVVCCGAVLLFNWSALGWKTLAVPTGSMRPAIPSGSLVLMHRVPDNSLKVGDVITYISPINMKKTITHRIVKVYKIDGKVPAFVTKGDTNPSADPPVVAGLVKGKIAWHIPYVGRFMIWSKTWAGIAVLVYLPALLIMIEEVRRLSDYLKSLEPYRLAGYRAREQVSRLPRRFSMAGSLTAALVIASAFLWQPALALLKSNTVVLANNRLSVAAVNQCPGNTNNHTSINIDNSSSQTASSGSASSSGNTNGGSATSGSASNSNSTSITVNVKNC